MVAALLRPWRDARTWRELAHLCLDLPVGTVTFTVVVTLLAMSLGLAVVAPLAVPVVWLLFAAAQARCGGVASLIRPIWPRRRPTLWTRCLVCGP